MWWIDILFPFSCVFCHKFGSLICTSCLKNSGYTPLVCAICRKPSKAGTTHDRCRTEWSPDSLISIWQYKRGVKKAIQTMKYKFAYQFAFSLGRALSAALTKYDLPKRAIVVPIPLERSRFMWRGFNQSEEIAGIVAKKFEWSIEQDFLLASKRASSQARLRAFSRSQNIRGKFAVNTTKTRLFANNSLPIILIDDVVSTGSTLFEATRVLRSSGAKNIIWITLAR